MSNPEFWPKKGRFELEHVENLEHTEGRLPTSGLFFKANKEMVARLGIGKGAGSKRRRLTGITVAFDNKSTGNIAVGDEHAASFDVKFNKEDDGAVTECFEMADGTGTLKAGGTVLGKLQLGRTGNDHKAIAAGLTGAYRASAAKRGKTRQLSTVAAFRTNLFDFEIPEGKAPAATDGADLEAQVETYTAGRKQFVTVNAELKAVARAIQDLGKRWTAESGAAKEARAKEIKVLYREHDEIYAERYDYCKQLQDFLTDLRTRIEAYQEQEPD
eukprot:m.188086 g.188086  ORF g.188086 m.188086 type:complete len:272 (-) comp24810_c0_seq1:48-863(-)